MDFSLHFLFFRCLKFNWNFHKKSSQFSAEKLMKSEKNQKHPISSTSNIRFMFLKSRHIFTQLILAHTIKCSIFTTLTQALLRLIWCVGICVRRGKEKSSALRHVGERYLRLERERKSQPTLERGKIIWIRKWDESEIRYRKSSHKLLARKRWWKSENRITNLSQCRSWCCYEGSLKV